MAFDLLQGFLLIDIAKLWEIGKHKNRYKMAVNA